MRGSIAKSLPIRMSEKSSTNIIIAVAAIVLLIAIAWVWKGGFAIPSIAQGGEPIFIGAGIVTVALIAAVYYIYKRA